MRDVLLTATFFGAFVLGLRHSKPLATGAALLPRSLCQFTRTDREEEQ